MNTIYLISHNRSGTHGLITDHFATDEEELERIVRYEFSTCCIAYSRIVVDMAAKVVRVIDEDGDVIQKLHIWTVRRLP